MVDSDVENCPVCNGPLIQKPRDIGWIVYFRCNNCGKFGLDESILDNQQLPQASKITVRTLINDPRLTKAWDPQKTTIIDDGDIKEYLEAHVEPKAPQLLENLISFYCNDEIIGENFHQNLLELSVAAKTLRFDTGEWAIMQANSMGWVDSFKDTKTQSGSFSATFRISADGWKAFYESQRKQSNSKQAFLALQFNNETLKTKIVPHLKSACEKAGFKLIAVNENRKAGLIDDKIRVDIRNSKFLVVDISDQNPGAYFEAGFAEGLGKPVFYICDKFVFEKHHRNDKREKTVHFDIEHHDIITWEVEKPDEIAEQLLASIRNTLPKDSEMSD